MYIKLYICINLYKKLYNILYTWRPMNEEPAGMKSAFQCCRVGGNKHTLVKRKLDLASRKSEELKT